MIIIKAHSIVKDHHESLMSVLFLTTRTFTGVNNFDAFSIHAVILIP